MYFLQQACDNMPYLKALEDILKYLILTFLVVYSFSGCSLHQFPMDKKDSKTTNRLKVCNKFALDHKNILNDKSLNVKFGKIEVNAESQNSQKNLPYPSEQLFEDLGKYLDFCVGIYNKQ